jgi:glycosyltransferase involved in cell wall biosynthesis
MRYIQVSVIIPHYNRGNQCQSTIESIQNQLFKNWECIIVDDGSEIHFVEELKEIIQKDARFSLIKRPDSLPKGANACRNYGLEVSKGKYIQWFDSDDIMFPDFLESKVDYLNQNEGINYVVSQTAWNCPELNLGKAYSHNLDSSDVFRSYINGETFFLIHGPLFRKSFFERVGKFDVKLKKHQEFEFFFRVLFQDKNFGIIPKVTAEHIVHENQMTLQKKSELELIRLSTDAFFRIIKFVRHKTHENKKTMLQALLNRIRTNLKKFIFRGDIQYVLISGYYYSILKCQLVFNK